MTLYRVRDWEKHFEVRDTRRHAGPLKWVAVPTKTDGFGFGRLRMQKNAPELLAAWYLMLGIAAKQPAERRGELSRDGRPLTPDDLELMTGFRAQLFNNALAFFSDEKQGWLECVQNGSIVKNGHMLDTDCAERVPTVQYNTRHVGCAAVAAPASDSDWMDSIRANPAYEGIDVDREHAKMLVWCQTNRKQPSRRRFVAWLNRVDRPMVPQAGKSATPRASLPEPDDWRAWINENAPDAVYARGNAEEGKQWNELDQTTQKWITTQMTHSSAR